jgi:hypothetical protein
MNTFITQGKIPVWLLDYRPLVEYGLARIVGNQTHIKEPLSLVSIMRYFESKGLTPDKTIWGRIQDNQGIGFEDAVLLAVTKLLRHGRKLNDIFDFHESSPTWADCTAKIVTQISSGHFESFDMVTDQPVIPSTGVAISAKEVVDVRDWLHHGGASWCIPGQSMGPDLMTWLQLSDGNYLLLVIQAKCHTTGTAENIAAGEVASAIQSLIPDNFFAGLVG